MLLLVVLLERLRCSSFTPSTTLVPVLPMMPNPLAKVEESVSSMALLMSTRRRSNLTASLVSIVDLFPLSLVSSSIVVSSEFQRNGREISETNALTSFGVYDSLSMSSCTIIQSFLIALQSPLSWWVLCREVSLLPSSSAGVLLLVLVLLRILSIPSGMKPVP